MGTDPILFAIFQLMLLLSASRARRHEEPLCTSRFDFEEKLLQKMIRLEHNMELLQDLVAKQLNELKEEKRNIFGETKVFLGEMRTDQEDALVATSEARKEMEKSMKEFIDAKQLIIDEKMMEMNNFLNNYGSTVIFSVIEPKKDMVDERATFNKVLANEGHAYNVTTGKFTSPFKGIYLFTFNVRSINSNYCYCYIRKNGAREAYAISDGSNDMGAVTLYLELQVGDAIDLGGCSQWANVNPKGTIFSGQLIVRL